MSESLSKKKSKKRRKGRNGKANGATDQPNKTPEVRLISCDRQGSVEHDPCSSVGPNLKACTHNVVG